MKGGLQNSDFGGPKGIQELKSPWEPGREAALPSRTPGRCGGGTAQRLLPQGHAAFHVSPSFHSPPALTGSQVGQLFLFEAAFLLLQFTLLKAASHLTDTRAAGGRNSFLFVSSVLFLFSLPFLLSSSLLMSFFFFFSIPPHYTLLTFPI